MHGGQGYVCPISLPAYQAAEKGFEIAFGKKPLAVRRGGSIPIISTFEQVLGTKTVLMGFGLGIGCDPFTQRKLLAGHIPERNRGSD